MAIAKELNICGIRQADVYLAAGLPMTWIRNQRDAFREYLLRNEQVAFLFNGKDYMIRFVGCSVYPQGYPAIVNQLGAFNGINLLADIGNGTMNILYVNDRKPMENRCWTEKHGARWKTRRVFHPGRRPGRDGSIQRIEAPRLISA